jgi:CHAD domain-containing protein
MDAQALFARNFDKSAARVKKRLAAYLKDPEDGDSVHDMRTSLRRLEAAFSLMPKKQRKKNRRLMDAHKAFFRANSQVRDLDIIRSRISFVGNEGFDAVIAKRRKQALGRALALARSLQKLPQADSGGIDGKKLAARMDKVAGRLLDSAKERLPAVAADSSKKKELHELRKDLKKLRYVLEILPAARQEKYGKELVRVAGGKDASARLRELQSLLGLIHDCDITIEYLQGKQGAEQILERENAERDALFKKFAATA